MDVHVKWDFVGTCGHLSCVVIEGNSEEDQVCSSVGPIAEIPIQEV